MRYRELGNTSALVSVIGFGASPLGDVFGPVEQSEADRAVHRAIASGINFFDVSPYYGNTLAERRLGHALRGHRSRVILATKCGRYGLNSFDFSARCVFRSIDESLARLQTDYVDLLQAHDVEFGDERQILEETIPALEEVRRLGKARWIGITGYSLDVLRRLAEASSVDTVLSYCHYNLLADDLDLHLLPTVQARGIGLINASPLHMGILTRAGAPAWHPAPAAVRQAGQRYVDYCEAHGLDPAVIALRFCLEHPAVACTLVGIKDEQQLNRNLEALDFELTPQLLEDIRQLLAPAHGITWA
jgi:L-galactose dehydrogenase